MAFVRLGGCSVGCKECDTDYKTDSVASAQDIAEMVKSVTPTNARDRWVWITGGEPADHNLRPLFDALRSNRYSIAVASSGHKRIIPPVEWLSISPHGTQLLQTYGNEIKIIPGLNGCSLKEFLSVHPDSQTDFLYRYVQPLWVNGKESEESLKECIEFLKTNPNWALSRQDHKYWGVL